MENIEIMHKRASSPSYLVMKSRVVEIVKEVTACDILPVVMFPSRIEISWTVDRDPLRCLSDVHTHSDSSQLTDDHDNDRHHRHQHHHHLPQQIFFQREFLSISKQPTSFPRPELSSRVSQMRKLPELKFKWHSIQSKQ